MALLQHSLYMRRHHGYYGNRNTNTETIFVITQVIAGRKKIMAWYTSYETSLIIRAAKCSYGSFSLQMWVITEGNLESHIFASSSEQQHHGIRRNRWDDAVFCRVCNMFCRYQFPWGGAIHVLVHAAGFAASHSSLGVTYIPVSAWTACTQGKARLHALLNIVHHLD